MNETEARTLKVGDDVLWRDPTHHEDEEGGRIIRIMPHGVMIRWDDGMCSTLTYDDMADISRDGV